MVWYAHLFQNFPQFIVIHIVKGFGIVNKAEIDVFLELPCFFDDPVCIIYIYIESMKVELKEAECSMVVSRSWSVQEKERCWSKYTDF